MNMATGYGGQGYVGQRQPGFSNGAYAPQAYQNQNYQTQAYGNMYQSQFNQNGWGMTGPVQNGRTISPTRGMNGMNGNPQMRDRHASHSEGSDHNGLIYELQR